MPDRPDAIPALTGLRFIAAISVVLAHGLNAMAILPEADPFWRIWLCFAAAFGMSAFFVLSGFVIHYNYSDSIRDDHWRGTYNFLAARFARLYPLYFICVVLSLYDHGYFFNLIYGEPTLSNALRETAWRSAPYYLTLTQSWTFSIVGLNSLIYAFPFSNVSGVSWSVSTELFFYIVYPIICLNAVKLTRIRHTLACGAVLAFVTLGLLGLVYYFSPAIDSLAVAHYGAIAGMAHAGSQDSFVRWLVYFAPYSRLAEFALGCLVAVLYRQAALRKVSRFEGWVGFVVASLSIATIVAMSWVIALPYPNPAPFLQFLHMNFGFALPVAVLVFCIARYSNAISRALAHPVIVRCGDASYSIYLLHVLVIEGAGLDVVKIGQRFDWTSVALLRLAVAMLVTVSLSLVTYQLIEVPARRLLRRVLTIGPASPVRALTPQPATGSD